MIAATTAVTFYNLFLVLAVLLLLVETILIATKTGGNHGWLLPLGLTCFAAAFLALSAFK